MTKRSLQSMHFKTNQALLARTVVLVWNSGVLDQRIWCKEVKEQTMQGSKAAAECLELKAEEYLACKS
jgi:hypothetical protein